MSGGGTSSYNPLNECSQRGITLSNTLHSEIASCLILPSLPVFCGAVDQELCLFDDQPRRPLSNQIDLLAQAGRIAEMLRETDVSYLDLKNDVEASSHRAAVESGEDLDLCDEVLRYNDNAFECNLGVTSLDSNEMSWMMKDTTIVQDHERLQTLVDTAIASAKRNAEADTEMFMYELRESKKKLKTHTERFMCEFRAVIQDEECIELAKRRKVLGAAPKVKLAEVYEELFDVQERMEEEVLAYCKALKVSCEREQTKAAESLLAVESLRLQVKRMEEENDKLSNEKEEHAKKADSLQLQLQEVMKVDESLRAQVAMLEREKEEAKKLREEYIFHKFI